jgi:hypothetical protein
MSLLAKDLIDLARESRTQQSRLVLALLALNLIAPGVANVREGL